MYLHIHFFSNVFSRHLSLSHHFSGKQRKTPFTQFASFHLWSHMHFALRKNEQKQQQQKTTTITIGAGKLVFAGGDFKVLQMCV